MKKLHCLLMVFIMTILLTGCSNLVDKKADNDAGLQIAFDISKKAEEYTQQLLHAHLKEQGVEDYSITQTHRGFITDNPVVFIVGYQYTLDSSESYYGYKLALDEDQPFTVLEEGIPVGEFIMK